MTTPTDHNYPSGQPFADGNQHLGGVPWYEAPAPPEHHQHWAQSTGYINEGRERVERCACGAIQSDLNPGWTLLDRPRVADHDYPSGQPSSVPPTTQSYVPPGNIPPIVELGPNDPPPPPGTPYHRNFDPNNPPQFPGGAPEPKRRNWFARHKVLTGLGAAFLLIVGISVAASGGDGGGGVAVAPSVAPPSMPPIPSEQASANKAASNAPKAPPAPTVQPKPTAPALTTAQKNAVRSAQEYLSSQGFSRSGLITQLSDFEGYSKADATFAVDYVHADWKTQAVRVARSYLDSQGFSRSGLITQLTQFEGFTRAQATYAADKVGL